MAARLGRRLRVYDASVSPRVLLAGVQTKSMKFNAEPVDITSDDDAGWRTLLATPGLKSLDLSVGGISKEAKLLQLWAASNVTKPIELQDADTNEEIAATFFLQSYTQEGPTSGGMAFSAELLSSGAVVYTPGP